VKGTAGGSAMALKDAEGHRGRAARLGREVRGERRANADDVDDADDVDAIEDAAARIGFMSFFAVFYPRGESSRSRASRQRAKKRNKA